MSIRIPRLLPQFKAPSSRMVEKGGDDEDLDLVAQTYEFSAILTSAPSRRS